MSMHTYVSTSVGAPIIKSQGNDAVTQKSRHISTEPKLSGIRDIDPAQISEVPSATMVHPSLGDDSNINFLANLSRIIFEIAPESNKPYTSLGYSDNFKSWLQFGVIDLDSLRLRRS